MSSKTHVEVRETVDGLRKKEDLSLVDILTLAEVSIIP